MNKVTKFRIAYQKYCEKLARNAMKTKVIKWILTDFKHHFKQNKWPLNYASYKASSNLGPQDSVFLTILNLNGYKVAMDKYRTELVITKRHK